MLLLGQQLPSGSRGNPFGTPWFQRTSPTAACVRKGCRRIGVDVIADTACQSMKHEQQVRLWEQEMGSNSIHRNNRFCGMHQISQKVTCISKTDILFNGFRPGRPCFRSGFRLIRHQLPIPLWRHLHVFPEGIEEVPVTRKAEFISDVVGRIRALDKQLFGPLDP